MNLILRKSKWIGRKGLLVSIIAYVGIIIVCMAMQEKKTRPDITTNDVGRTMDTRLLFPITTTTTTTTAMQGK